MEDDATFLRAPVLRLTLYDNCASKLRWNKQNNYDWHLELSSIHTSRVWEIILSRVYTYIYIYFLSMLKLYIYYCDSYISIIHHVSCEFRLKLGGMVCTQIDSFYAHRQGILTNQTRFALISIK